MKLSVIMSVYNENIDWLREAIESVLNQSYKNFEFIIILDNPNATHLQKIINDYVKIDDRIRFYINEENKGLVYSLNRALELSNGEFIARMDADDICEPLRLEKEMYFIEKNKLDLVGTAISIINEKNEVIGSMNNYGNTPITCLNSLKYRNCIVHPTWLFRKSIVDKNGGYKDIPTAEDYEFLCRMALNNVKMCNIDEKLLKYRRRNNSISIKNLRIQFNISKIIRKAYKNSLKTSKKYDSYILEQKIKNMSLKNKRLVFDKGIEIYLKGCNFLSKGNKVKGLLYIVSAIILSPEILGNLIASIMIKKENERSELRSEKNN